MPGERTERQRLETNVYNQDVNNVNYVNIAEKETHLHDNQDYPVLEGNVNIVNNDTQNKDNQAQEHREVALMKRKKTFAQATGGRNNEDRETIDEANATLKELKELIKWIKDSEILPLLRKIKEGFNVNNSNHHE